MIVSKRDASFRGGLLLAFPLLNLCSCQKPKESFSTKSKSRYSPEKNQKTPSYSPSHGRTIAKWRASLQGHIHRSVARAAPVPKVIELQSSSNISIDDETNLTPEHLMHDPLARPSRRMSRSQKDICGDGDVWEEKLCKNKKTGKVISFFYSQNTGERKRGEPPSGASRVQYLPVKQIGNIDTKYFFNVIKNLRKKLKREEKKVSDYQAEIEVLKSSEFNLQEKLKDMELLIAKFKGETNPKDQGERDKCDASFVNESAKCSVRCKVHECQGQTLTYTERIERIDIDDGTLESKERIDENNATIEPIEKVDADNVIINTQNEVAQELIEKTGEDQSEVAQEPIEKIDVDNVMINSQNEVSQELIENSGLDQSAVAQEPIEKIDVENILIDTQNQVSQELIENSGLDQSEVAQESIEKIDVDDVMIDFQSEVAQEVSNEETYLMAVQNLKRIIEFESNLKSELMYMRKELVESDETLKLFKQGDSSAKQKAKKDPLHQYLNEQLQLYQSEAEEARNHLEEIVTARENIITEQVNIKDLCDRITKVISSQLN